MASECTWGPQEWIRKGESKSGTIPSAVYYGSSVLFVRYCRTCGFSRTPLLFVFTVVYI